MVEEGCVLSPVARDAAACREIAASVYQGPRPDARRECALPGEGPRPPPDGSARRQRGPFAVRAVHLPVEVAGVDEQDGVGAVHPGCRSRGDETLTPFRRRGLSLLTSAPTAGVGLPGYAERQGFGRGRGTVGGVRKQ